MNCHEFRTGLDQLEGAPVPEGMAGHARLCAACQALLRADRRVGASLNVLERSTPPVQLTPRIMAAIARERPAREETDSPFWRFFLGWFPATGLQRSLALACGIILLAILVRQTTMGPTVTRSAPAWEMSLLAFDATRVPGDWATRRTGIALLQGQPVDLGAGSRVSLQLPGKAAAVITDGAFTPLASGFRLAAGQATVQVEKTAPDAPFTVSTPFAEVVVVGTRFTLDLTAEGLQVAVSEGRVRVVHASGLREVNPGEALQVGPAGFIEPGMTAVAPFAPPLTQSGSASSSLEEDNPGR